MTIIALRESEKLIHVYKITADQIPLARIVISTILLIATSNRWDHITYTGNLASQLNVQLEEGYTKFMFPLPDNVIGVLRQELGYVFKLGVEE